MVFMRKILLFVVILFGLSAVNPAFAYNASLDPYTDITSEDWATASIYRLSAIDIISGYPDRTFREHEERKVKPDTEIHFSYPYFLTNIQYSNQDDENTIWYEDSSSIEQKIWLAKYYGLKGVSLWHIGNFTETDWDVMKVNPER